MPGRRGEAIVKHVLVGEGVRHGVQRGGPLRLRGGRVFFTHLAHDATLVIQGVAGSKTFDLLKSSFSFKCDFLNVLS